MAGSGRATEKAARAARLAVALGRWCLLGAGLLGGGCGGRAEGVSREEPAPVTQVPERGGPTRLGGASGVTTPSPAPTVAPDAVPTFCYSPTELERTPELEEMLPTLPAEAFDGAGCLAADYSDLLTPGRCVYDPSGAELTAGRCCYRLDSLTEDCPL
ncbi:MAG TPA: hypothetical protein VNN80_08055 [Polyangiaceae bacterium]|nr:hypothetical protein [Polyangiaceae bacterium]